MRINAVWKGAKWIFRISKIDLKIIYGHFALFLKRRRIPGVRDFRISIFFEVIFKGENPGLFIPYLQEVQMRIKFVKKA